MDTCSIWLFLAPIKSLRASLPGEFRLAPHTTSPGWHMLYCYYFYSSRWLPEPLVAWSLEQAVSSKRVKKASLQASNVRAMDQRLTGQVIDNCSAFVHATKVIWCVQDIWLDQEDVQLLKEGEEVTLMDWGNAVVEGIQKGPDGAITGQCSCGQYVSGWAAVNHLH